jgi:arginyl-tRNA synthetase
MKKLKYPSQTIEAQIDLIIRETVKEVFGIELDSDRNLVEQPKDANFGDYASNVAMQLTKEVGSNPREIAEHVVSNITKSNNIFEKVEIAGPGFINFKIKIDRFIEAVENLDLKPNLLKSEKYIFEFTDPNPFKEFHIGHLYSNSVGEALSRLHEHLGAEVKRADYFGDVGMHVSKSLWGLIAKMDEDEITIEDLEKRSLKERINYLGQSYAKGATAYKEDDLAKEGMKDINYMVFVAGQEFLIESIGWEPLVDYKKFIQKDTKINFELIKKLYFKGKKWSLDYFEEIYKRVGTKFDYYYPESIAGEFGMEIVLEGLKKGIFEKSDGAIIFNGKKYGLHDRVFINSLGLPTYEAKELGLAPTKYKDFKYEQSVIITANEINEYFKVLLKALSLVRPELGAITTHIGHGMVKLPEGKMSSRTGKIVTGEWLIDTAKERAMEVTKLSQKVDENSMDEVAEIIGIGGIKYAFLKSAIGGDLVFSFEDSITFEGNSGPYIQYTYARCKSIISNAGVEDAEKYKINNEDLNPSEISVIRLIEKYTNVLVDSKNSLTLHLLCNYLFDLAQAFNNFYQESKVVGDKYESRRLSITHKVSEIIKSGLDILGIRTVERM